MTFLVLWFYNVEFSSEMLKWYFTYMEEAIQGINQLLADRLIEKYAIGGAMAATFYVEPILTYDLDVFILLPESSGVAVLTPLNEYLEKRGCYSEKEYISIEGVPVQFLPIYNDLLKESLDNARRVTLGATETFIPALEYLAALCVQTGRPKDRERVRLFIEEATMDMEKLRRIPAKHNLENTWNDWIR